MNIFWKRLASSLVMFSIAMPVYAHSNFSLAENDEKDDRELPRGVELRLKAGKDLPPGIEKKIEKDVQAPAIIGITVVERTQTSARILWVTDERANSKLWVSETLPVPSGQKPSAQSADFTYFHSLKVNNLKAGTSYSFVVASADRAGNSTMSDVKSFMTEPSPSPVPDTIAPVISDVDVRALTDVGARIRWSTNERATGKVFVSAVNPIVDANAKVFVASELKLNHVIELNGLSARTQYFAAVEVRDTSGNVSRSQLVSFTTLSQ